MVRLLVFNTKRLNKNTDHEFIMFRLQRFLLLLFFSSINFQWYKGCNLTWHVSYLMHHMMRYYYFPYIFKAAMLTVALASVVKRLDFVGPTSLAQSITCTGFVYYIYYRFCTLFRVSLSFYVFCI